MNQIPVEQVAATKSLGLHIDQNLNWEFHISEISNTIATGISSFRRITNLVPREILLTVYYS